MPALLLLGASGAIGQALAGYFNMRGWAVTGIARAEKPELDTRIDWRFADFSVGNFQTDILDNQQGWDAVCWAQGANCNDNVRDVDIDAHLDLYRANCVYILKSLKLLLDRDQLARPARLCIISSIWQKIARQNKLSYGMTKAALQGLVLSAAADLASDGHLINAVLPGALDTEMTRNNLSAQQISMLANATLFDRLPQLSDVAGLVHFLCSDSNTGITGQFIAADLGFSHVRIV